MQKEVKRAEKKLITLRDQMTELKKNIALPDFVSKFKSIREEVMTIYRSNSQLITKDDLVLFGIIVKKEK